jgi:N6-L-threonylcarbamoyladenine synthase
MPGKYDFSYSGVKTAVLRTAQKSVGKDHTFPSFEIAALLSEQQKADFSASFQRVAVETVVDKTVRAYEEFKPKSVVIGGGVAANTELRNQLSARLPHEVKTDSQSGHSYPIEYTDIRLCTDNGAMIAALGSFKVMRNQPVADPYSLEIQPNLSM